jgi:hypothetical protein
MAIVVDVTSADATSYSPSEVGNKGGVAIYGSRLHCDMELPRFSPFGE